MILNKPPFITRDACANYKSFISQVIEHQRLEYVGYLVVFNNDIVGIGGDIRQPKGKVVKIVDVTEYGCFRISELDGDEIENSFNPSTFDLIS